MPEPCPSRAVRRGPAHAHWAPRQGRRQGSLPAAAPALRPAPASGGPARLCPALPGSARLGGERWAPSAPRPAPGRCGGGGCGGRGSGEGAAGPRRLGPGTGRCLRAARGEGLASSGERLGRGMRLALREPPGAPGLRKGPGDARGKGVEGARGWWWSGAGGQRPLGHHQVGLGAVGQCPRLRAVPRSRLCRSH